MIKKNPTLTSQIRIERCSVCGAILQEDDPSSAGFISHERIEKSQEKGLCDRCYNLRHYNAPGDPSFGSDYIKILKQAVQEEALVVYVVDLFDLESSFVPEIGAYLGKKVLCVLNKRDVLPEEETDEAIKAEARRKLAMEKVYPSDIVITSSAKNLNIKLFFDLINSLRNGKNVYFIGASSVGKSSLVSSLLRIYSNSTDRVISTFRFPETRLDVMEIPLDRASSIYDTPGIYNPRSLVNQVERSAWKYLVPREKITPREYLSPASQAFIMGGLAIFELTSGPKTRFVFELSNEVSITRTKSANLEKTFASLAQTGQVRPTSDFIKTLGDLKKQEIAIPAEGKMEISLFGLGKVTFQAGNQRLAVYLPEHVGVRVLAEEEN
jgi:ribosome biogenesis GTPase YqeH